MKYVDTHAHIFDSDVPAVQGARYHPDYSATVNDYLHHLDGLGIEYGVLIQPSFLGTDNSQMLRAIATHPQRLKGVAVVLPDSSLADLQVLKAQGIVGARLNLFGLAIPNLSEPQWQQFLHHLEELGWQLELHCPPAYLRQLIPALQEFKGPIVLDHFGRVDPELGVDDADYQFMLEQLDQRYWVKVSGHYRLGADGWGQKQAHRAFGLLLEYGMADRLIWGSDWPHTQHENLVSYAETFDFLQELVQDPALKQAILSDNALQLFGFKP